MNYQHVKRGCEWLEAHLLKRVGNANASALYHHGIKGQKWGVKNGPPYPLKDKKEIVKSEKYGKMTTKVFGHSGPAKRATPNSIIDHVSNSGFVKSRAFYDDAGWKEKEIHTTNHGNPKHHPYGTHGEHIHYYTWDQESGQRIGSKTEEIPSKLRKENEDIL